MGIELNGKTIETTGNGFLVNQEDWSADITKIMAENEGITLTQKHWDIINYLRDQYSNHNGELANNRAIVKAMAEKWGEKIEQKAIFDLFPGNPSKQGGRIAGLPESMRKGGY